MSSRRSLRILFVTHAFLPDSSAGVELYTLRLARGLVDRGHRAVIVTSRQRPGTAQYAVLDEQVEGLPVRGIVQNWPYRDLPEAVTDPAVDRIFEGLVQEHRPDLIAVQTVAHLSAGVLTVAARLGVPTVVHLHDAWWSCASGGQRRTAEGRNCLPVDPELCGACFDRYRHTEGPIERASRWVAGRIPGVLPPDSLHRLFGALPSPARDGIKQLNRRLAGLRGDPVESSTVALDPRISARRDAIRATLGGVGRVLSPSRFLLESLAADGVELPSGRVLGSGVPLGGPVAPLAADRSGPLRVLFLGTWVPHKGPQVLARALARVKRPIEAIGAGPTPFPDFVSEVLRLSEGRLDCRGPVPAAEVAGLIDGCDALVVPSTWAENAPLVALEARSRRRPVLATDLGGLPELVREGVDGRLFPVDDDAALAALLDDHEDVRALGDTVRPPRSLDAFVAEVEGEYLEQVR